MAKKLYALSGQDHATILAALRFYQEKGMGDPANRSEAIHEIATCGDTEISLDADGIDGLCESINGGDACVSQGFTVWVMQDNGKGTHHVSHHAVATAEEAEAAALEECASDWERDDTDGLEVLGVAYGDVRLHSWNDPGD